MSSEAALSTSTVTVALPALTVRQQIAVDATNMTRQQLAEKYGLTSKTVLTELRYEALARCRNGEKVDAVRKLLGLTDKEFSYLPNRGKKWTADDVAYLKAHANDSLDSLSDTLGRTKEAIEIQLGLRERNYRNQEEKKSETPRRYGQVRIQKRYPSPAARPSQNAMQTPISDLSKLTKTQLIALLQAQRV
jgi:hypothetical protein